MTSSTHISKSKERAEEDPYSTLHVENLLGGLNEWRNINDIVRSTMKALCEVVRSQGIAIRELEKQVSTKASKSELNSGLNIKANVADVMRTFSEVASSIECRPTHDELQSLLDDKVSRTDLNYYLNSKPSLEEVRQLIESKASQVEMQSEISNINSKIEEFQKEFHKKSVTLASSKDILQITQILEQKANANDVNEALASKASKESVINALHRKANKVETESALKSKVDFEDFQNLINTVNNKADLNDVDKINAILENKSDRAEMLSISTILNTKAELKDFELLNVCYQELKRENTKRMDDLDQDIDRLIENIKNEFQNLNIVISNIDMKKVDFKDFEKVSNSISKKIDSEHLNSSISQLKTDIYESFGHYKNDIHQNKKIFEENLNEKIAILDKNIEKLLDEINRNKDKFNDIYEKRKSDQEENIKFTKQLVNTHSKDISSETNLLKNEIQRMNNEMIEIINKKLDKKEFDLVKNKIFTEFEQKAELADLDGIYKNLQKEISDKIEENKKTLNQSLKSFENEIIKALDKKANMYDVTTLMNNKADAASINLAIQNKIGVSEFENLKLAFEKYSREVMNKLDYGKFEAYMADTRNSIEDINKDLMMKANIKEILNLMKNKADIDDVNKALTQIHEELDAKCSLEQFNSAMDNQSIINDALCSENCVARWTWKSGLVKNGYAVPWEIQTVNTAPDNFLWEKEKTSVMVVAAGLYEISMGFYSDKKPTVQILVNGEPILSAVNSASYVIHHSSGKMKSLGKHTNGNITGLTLIDYICLPERSRIAISYSGEEGAEGFLALRKI